MFKRQCHYVSPMNQGLSVGNNKCNVKKCNKNVDYRLFMNRDTIHRRYENLIWFELSR